MKSYSERAEATRKKIIIYQKARRKKILISVVSLCSCLLIAFNLVMFVPYTTYPSGYIDLSAYQSSQYYDIIKELSYIQYGDSIKPVYKNNFQRLAESIKDGLADGEPEFGNTNDGASAAPGAPGESAPGVSGGEHYEETTDNQVVGVTEGDLIKRTNAYIYYLSLKNYSLPTLRVYPIAGAETECIAEFALNAKSDFVYYGYNAEMYLSQDGTTVTLVLPVLRQWHNKGKYFRDNYTEVVNVDVSDHANIDITGRYFVSGEYVSSRLVNGELLLVTNFTVSRGVDFSDEKQFVPSTGTGGDMNCLPAMDIHCPENPSYSRFTVVCSVNAQTLEETGSEAFLSYSENVYVSENNIYLTNGYICHSEQPLDTSHELRGDAYHYVNEYKTEISRVKYGGELNYEGSFTVEGEVISRFCMDEKDGVIRVVTSPHRYEYIYGGNYYNHYFTDGASLYCIDIETYKVVGKLENFAPVEDEVQSARFEGDKVYVCTAVVMTDPVFAIDISDYNDITFVDTGEIPGYSIALRKFYGDTLLGIGYNGNSGQERNLKIEIYKENESNVESVATFTYLGGEIGGWYYDYADVYFSAEYKAYFIDAERGLIGLGLTVYAFDFESKYYSSISLNRYILLQYDGENLSLLLDLDLKGEEDYRFYDLTRAVYVDGIFYLFTGNGHSVTELHI